VTDFAADALPGHQPAPGTGTERPPGVVYAAAIVTWVGATMTAAFTLLLTVGLLWMATPLFDTFDSGADNPRWWLIGTAAIVVALSLAADVAALFVFRGRRWAQWMLVGLCVVAALGGVVSGYYIAPLVVTAATVSVVVLLVLPDSRAWFREAHSRSRGLQR
jgi:hypothetical protein